MTIVRTLDGLFILLLLHVDYVDGRIGSERFAQFRQFSEIGGPAQIDATRVIVQEITARRFGRIGPSRDDDILLFATIAVLAAALGRTADAAVRGTAGPRAPLQLLLDVTVVYQVVRQVFLHRQ